MRRSQCSSVLKLLSLLAPAAHGFFSLPAFTGREDVLREQVGEGGEAPGPHWSHRLRRHGAQRRVRCACSQTPPCWAALSSAQPLPRDSPRPRLRNVRCVQRGIVHLIACMCRYCWDHDMEWADANDIFFAHQVCPSIPPLPLPRINDNKLVSRLRAVDFFACGAPLALPRVRASCYSARRLGPPSRRARQRVRSSSASFSCGGPRLPSGASVSVSPSAACPRTARSPRCDEQR